MSVAATPISSLCLVLIILHTLCVYGFTQSDLVYIKGTKCTQDVLIDLINFFLYIIFCVAFCKHTHSTQNLWDHHIIIKFVDGVLPCCCVKTFATPRTKQKKVCGSVFFFNQRLLLPLYVRLLSNIEFDDR